VCDQQLLNNAEDQDSFTGACIKSSSEEVDKGPAFDSELQTLMDEGQMPEELKQELL